MARTKLNTVKNWFKAQSRKVNWGGLLNALTIAAFTVGVIALFALIWLYVRPIKVADIKVPVATDQASYYPGEEISGIFFGEIYHRGEVRVLREVFCKNFHGIIAPPESAKNGDFYDTQSIPRKIEGLNVNIGLLPNNVPVGANCVLQFTNVYNIQTPFGIRRIEYQYYTQNFSIVTIERRQQLECEASGRKDCNYLTDNPNASSIAPNDVPQEQESVDSARDTIPPQNVYYDNRTTTDYNETNPPAQAAPAPRFERQCRVDFAGVKAFCRQVQVN
ncbi:hypothetical protein [Polynucleobacter sp.]|uniref:hypothetical protein n=1 Tax=Polynucleobacter sp. TaxID=2029855 RepID=UPI003F6A0DA0